MARLFGQFTVHISNEQIRHSELKTGESCFMLCISLSVATGVILRIAFIVKAGIDDYPLKEPRDIYFEL